MLGSPYRLGVEGQLCTQDLVDVSLYNCHPESQVEEHSLVVVSANFPSGHTSTHSLVVGYPKVLWVAGQRLTHTLV